MTPAIQSAFSGARAFQTQMDVIANNVANASTAGFEKSRVVFAESEPHGVTASVEQGDTPEPVNAGASNVDLAEELTSMMLALHHYKTSLATIRSQDEMFEELSRLI